jgi:hypothetical protein
MDNFATPLTVLLKRVVDESIDIIAKEGLVLLKQTLDTAGFPNSEFLKNYEVLVRVRGGDIQFEIILDENAVVPANSITEQDLERDKKEEAANEISERARTYGLGSNGPRRLISRNKPTTDARKPARDARKPARDARKTADDRTLEHEVALRMPRSARINVEGKLSISTRRHTEKTKSTTQFPQGETQGIIDEFMSKLKDLISDTFAPKLGDLVARYIGK